MADSTADGAFLDAWKNWDPYEELNQRRAQINQKKELLRNRGRLLARFQSLIEAQAKTVVQQMEFAQHLKRVHTRQEAFLTHEDDSVAAMERTLKEGGSRPRPEQHEAVHRNDDARKGASEQELDHFDIELKKAITATFRDFDPKMYEMASAALARPLSGIKASTNSAPSDEAIANADHITMPIHPKYKKPEGMSISEQKQEHHEVGKPAKPATTEWKLRASSNVTAKKEEEKEVEESFETKKNKPIKSVKLPSEEDEEYDPTDDWPRPGYYPQVPNPPLTRPGNVNDKDHQGPRKVFRVHIPEEKLEDEDDDVDVKIKPIDTRKFIDRYKVTDKAEATGKE